MKRTLFLLLFALLLLFSHAPTRHGGTGELGRAGKTLALSLLRDEGLCALLGIGAEEAALLFSEDGALFS